MAKQAKVTNLATSGKIELGGKSSVGIYGTNNSELINNGIINVSDSGTATAINTGQKSLAFMTANGGKINFASATTATIQGGATAPDRGTAFYYTPSLSTPGSSPSTAGRARTHHPASRCPRASSAWVPPAVSGDPWPYPRGRGRPLPVSVTPCPGRSSGRTAPSPRGRWRTCMRPRPCARRWSPAPGPCGP